MMDLLIGMRIQWRASLSISVVSRKKVSIIRETNYDDSTGARMHRKKQFDHALFFSIYALISNFDLQPL